MSLTTIDAVVSIGELLDRVRECIGDVSLDTSVSLTIEVVRGGERQVLRLTVKPDDTLAPVSTSPHPSEHSTAIPSIGTKATVTDSEVGDRTNPDQQMEPTELDREMKEEERPEAARGVMEVETTAPTPPSIETFETGSGDVAGQGQPYSSVLSRTDENIRRSARKQSPVDRLVYERTTGKRKGSNVQAEAAAADTTDGQSDSHQESDAASSSSLSAPPSSTRQLRKKCRHQPTAREKNKEVAKEDEEEQVATLIKRFEDAYAARDEVSLEQISKDAVLKLGRDVVNGLSAVVLLDSAAYQQRAIQLDHLIATSAATRMLGYYLKGALAAKLKETCRTKYVHAARTLLRLKSSADISAHPAFYTFVQQHSPSIARGVIDVEAWLKEPIFLADIGWSEWRRYLTKQNCWMVSTALERFRASLQPAQDWMQRAWVEEYMDERLGRGVRATRDIPLASTKARHRSLGDCVVADLNIFEQAQALVALESRQQGQSSGDQSAASPPASASPYRFEWNHGKQVLDAEHLWVGRINHLPEKLCNLRLSSTGKLLQVKPIKAGEALTFDYTMPYWVEQVTGITWKLWMTTGTVACRKGCAELFERMHRTVVDYTSLLSQRWSERFARVTSEMDKEVVIMELWEQLVPEEERIGEEDGDTS